MFQNGAEIQKSHWSYKLIALYKKQPNLLYEVWITSDISGYVTCLNWDDIFE